MAANKANAPDGVTACRFMSEQFPYVSFVMCLEYLDEDGIWNPRDNDSPVEGDFVNIS